jgi:hypothetical protein
MSQRIILILNQIPKEGSGISMLNPVPLSLPPNSAKQLDLTMKLHPQPYTIGWLHQGRDLHVSQQCRLPYGIKPFKDKVLCDISPLEVCDVLLGQPYLWKLHDVYDSIPHSVIINLGRQLYRIP